MYRGKRCTEGPFVSIRSQTHTRRPGIEIATFLHSTTGDQNCSILTIDDRGSKLQHSHNRRLGIEIAADSQSTTGDVSRENIGTQFDSSQDPYNFPNPFNLKKPGYFMGYMYILLCSDGSYYVGSTKNLTLRINQHQSGIGANFTKKHLPVKLVYYECFPRIDLAFYREKQIQNWSRKKKEALINGEIKKFVITG